MITRLLPVITILRSESIGCQLVTEQFYPNSNCLKSTVHTLLPTQSGNGEGHFSTTSLQNIFQLLDDSSAIDVLPLDISTQTPKGMKPVKFIKSKRLNVAISIGDLLDIAQEWHEDYSKAFPPDHRALTNFLVCHNQDVTVCNLANASYFSNSKCSENSNGLGSKYGLSSPVIPSGVSLAMDGNQRVQFMILEELNKNEENYFYVTKRTETSDVFFQAFEDLKTYAIDLMKMLEIFDDKIKVPPRKPCFENNKAFSLLMKTSLRDEARHDKVCQVLKHEIETRKSQAIDGVRRR